jgi:hypothetical protein
MADDDLRDVRVEWLSIAADADAWRRVGLVVTDDGLIPLIGTSIRIVPPTGDPGIVGWTLSGIDPEVRAVAGLPTDIVATRSPVYASHELGASAIDHVVVTTGDLGATTTAITDATSCELKRVREAGPITQGFHRIGPSGLIVEVVHHDGDDESPASFWGVVIVVEDLDVACALIGADLISEPRDAVQSGRRIATLREEAGLGTRVALMSP